MCARIFRLSPTAGVLLLTFIGIYVGVIETQDKTLEEIQDEIGAKVGDTEDSSSANKADAEWSRASLNMDKVVRYGSLNDTKA